MMGIWQKDTALFIFLLGVIFSSTFATDLDPKDFHVECKEGGFEITVPLEKVGNLEFSFIDQSCHSFDNGTHLIGSTGYTDCGTVTRELDRGIEYTNELLNPNFLVSESKDEPCPHLKLKVTCFILYEEHVETQRRRKRRSAIESRIERTTGCRKEETKKYAFDEPSTLNAVNPEKSRKIISCPFLIGIGDHLQTDRVLTSTSIGRAINVRRKQTPCKPLKQRGNIRLLMTMHGDQSFTTEFNPESQSNDGWYSDVYYQISHLSGHDNFKMVPVTCYATPDSDPNNPLSYYYISNGCPVDPTVRFYKTSADGSSRFSITSFQFIDSKSRSFFSHCEVLVCDKDDQSPQCQKKCQQEGAQNAISIAKSRKRRSSYRVVKTKDGKIRLIHSKPRCPALLHVEKVGNLNIIYKVLVPRNLYDLRRRKSPQPFQITKIKTSQEKGELSFMLKPGRFSKYVIKECTFGYRQREPILRDGRSLRSSEYNGIFNVEPNNVITIDTKHEKSDPTKSSKLVCHFIVCDAWKNCLEECPARNKKGRRQKRADIVKEIKDGGKDIKVECLAKGMRIDILKRSTNTFHLRDETCQANSDGTLSTSYNKCGTKFVDAGDHYSFTNEIVEKVPDNIKIIRGPLLKKEVKCVLRKSQSSSKAIRLTRKRLTSTGVSSYQVKIDMFTDSKFTETNKQTLVEIDENQDMFFGVKVSSEAFRNNLEIHLDTCIGYNQPKNPREKRKTHVFIKDGCPYNDNSVKFYPTTDASQVRFSVKPFKFDGQTSIMINCFVTACGVNDQNSKCKKMQRRNADERCSR
eukprot:TCONS_00003290-protein